MRKKRITGICLIAAIAVLLCAMTACRQTPEITTVTVHHGNPRYSSLKVQVEIDSPELVEGLDMSLLYNMDKWELVEDSPQSNIEGVTLLVEDGQLRLIFENSQNQPLDGIVLTAAFEMIGKNDDPLGLRLEVGELFGGGELKDLDYTVEYLEEK